MNGPPPRSELRFRKLRCKKAVVNEDLEVRTAALNDIAKRNWRMHSYNERLRWTNNPTVTIVDVLARVFPPTNDKVQLRRNRDTLDVTLVQLKLVLYDITLYCRGAQVV